ncbi:MAG: EF-hand domain-containing protein [Planctomycetales bacterium]|nr:EF-hand domain-containing protein [Planctomycetales bacterium]
MPLDARAIRPNLVYRALRTARRRNDYALSIFARAVAIGLTLLTGCGGSRAIKAPPIDAEAVADKYLALYDVDQDGLIAGEELKASASLRDAVKNRIDSDNDGAISRTELMHRFERWVAGGVGAAVLSCRVVYKGRPLDGAQISLVPDAPLQGVIQPATGVTNSNGLALMAMDSANLPSDMANLRAVQQGLYRVEITHPTLDIPAKYNTDSSLGVEVSFETGRNLVEFRI